MHFWEKLRFKMVNIKGEGWVKLRLKHRCHNVFSTSYHTVFCFGHEACLPSWHSALALSWKFVRSDKPGTFSNFVFMHFFWFCFPQHGVFWAVFWSLKHQIKNKTEANITMETSKYYHRLVKACHLVDIVYIAVIRKEKSKWEWRDAKCWNKWRTLREVRNGVFITLYSVRHF